MPRFPDYLRLLACALLLPSAILAHARQDPLLVQVAAEDFLSQETRNLPGEVTISITPLSDDNRLSPCNKVEPFLAPGSKAWGRVLVGIRCMAGGTWTAYLRGQIKVTGSYLATGQALRPGQLLRPEDVELRTGELTQFPQDVLTDPAQVAGRVANVSIPAGQPLRNDMLRRAPAVQKGQNVTVFSRGDGFQVSTEGTALADATDGQVVQIRMTTGQVRSGIARPGGQVEMNY